MRGIGLGYEENIPVWIIVYLKKLFLKKIKKKYNYDNIYIDRSDSTQKHCKPINNVNVINLLKSKNFKILKLSNFSEKRFDHYWSKDGTIFSGDKTFTFIEIKRKGSKKFNLNRGNDDLG